MSEVSFHDNGQWTLEKSNYGPKGAKLYNIADNARRKANNVGAERVGNQSTKEYGGFGGSKVASLEDARIKRMNRKQPVKTYTPEEIEAYKKKTMVKFEENGQWHLE